MPNQTFKEISALYHDQKEISSKCIIFYINSYHIMPNQTFKEISALNNDEEILNKFSYIFCNIAIDIIKHMPQLTITDFY